MKKTIALSLVLAASMSLAASTTATAGPALAPVDEQLNDAATPAMDSITSADEATLQALPAAAPSALSFGAGITTT